MIVRSCTVCTLCEVFLWHHYRVRNFNRGFHDFLHTYYCDFVNRCVGPIVQTTDRGVHSVSEGADITFPDPEPICVNCQSISGLLSTCG